jgi:hypothetical protein
MPLDPRVGYPRRLRLQVTLARIRLKLLGTTLGVFDRNLIRAA